MSWRKENNIFYLKITSPQTVVHVSDYGIEMASKSCGLMRVYGKIKLKNFERLSPEERTLFLCSDLVSPESIISGGFELPALCQIVVNQKDNETVEMEPYNPIWLNVSEQLLTDISLNIRNAKREIVSVDDCFLDCTLLLYKPWRK